MTPRAVTTREMARFVREVEARLIEMAHGIPRHDAEKLRAYHGSGIPHLGLAVPVQRTALRQRYGFSKLPANEQLPIWDAVWRQGRYYETKSQALYCCAALRKPDDLVRAWPIVVSWIELVDNWDISDELSAIYSRILEVAPDKVYPVLCCWNRSNNPWKRRQSVLALLYYSRSRRSVLSAGKIFPLINRLVDDKDRFVQTAIGWTLREALTPYPAETAAFIEEFATRLSAIAFAGAASKLPPTVRMRLKASGPWLGSRARLLHNNRAASELWARRGRGKSQS